jgi:hypothetical protein
MPPQAGAFFLTDTVEKEYALCLANGMPIRCSIDPRAMLVEHVQVSGYRELPARDLSRAHRTDKRASSASNLHKTPAERHAIFP